MPVGAAVGALAAEDPLVAVTGPADAGAEFELLATDIVVAGGTGGNDTENVLVAVLASIDRLDPPPVDAGTMSTLQRTLPT